MDKINLETDGTDAINQYLQTCKEKKFVDLNKISDGYHTFGELYAHRTQLWITVARCLYGMFSANIYLNVRVWRSKFHSDGSTYEGWFLLGVTLPDGNQMSYHLPNEKWEECNFAKTLATAPEWDGHTSADVLERLKKL
jgi:hypothetical protein